MYHDRNTAQSHGRKHRRRKMTVEDVQNDKNELTGLGQTSINKDSVDQRPETLNPFGKSGSHVRKTRNVENAA